MLRDFAWNVFKKTGNIDSYMFLKEVEMKSKEAGEQEKAVEGETPDLM